ncbi:conserved hypothetical protein [Candida albicans WO-1]|uniref:Uncharacterized protein n=1 Tax=Candida albicans (strain WO-1) TaxID=294748 RepID=C4YJA9_CANAW|nr:conserved hypothetical protein [Candida albicans WO-1]
MASNELPPCSSSFTISHDLWYSSSQAYPLAPFKSLTSPRRDDRVLADIPLFAPPGDALFSGAVEGSLEDGDLEPMYSSSESSILTMCSFISSGMYFNICQRSNCFSLLDYAFFFSTYSPE